MRQHAQRLQRPVPVLSAEALTHLQGYAWPGNVRELVHWMERAVIVCEGERIALAEVLAIEEMGLSPPSASPVVQEDEGRDEQRQSAEGKDDEQQRIIAALERTNGVVSGDRGAARLLGMSVQTLRYRMRKYGIKRPKKSS